MGICFRTVLISALVASHTSVSAQQVREWTFPVEKGPVTIALHENENSPSALRISTNVDGAISTKVESEALRDALAELKKESYRFSRIGLLLLEFREPDARDDIARAIYRNHAWERYGSVHDLLVDTINERNALGEIRAALASVGLDMTVGSAEKISTSSPLKLGIGAERKRVIPVAASLQSRVFVKDSATPPPRPSPASHGRPPI
jgi:hypothetical protein